MSHSQQFIVKSCMAFWKRMLTPAFACTSSVPANDLLRIWHDACEGGNVGGSSDISSTATTRQSHDTRQGLQGSRTAAHNVHGQDQKRCDSRPIDDCHAVTCTLACVKRSLALELFDGHAEPAQL